MRNENKMLLTLEERLKRSAGSQAVSPEAAAKLVVRFSRIPASQIFFGKSDVDAMYELTGEFWDHPDVDIGSYHGFSHSFRLAIEHDNDLPQLSPLDMPQAKNRNPYEPVWGVRINNAMVLLGLMLLDHAKGSLRPKDIYHCTRMTLGQYLDALVDLGFQKNGRQDARVERFQSWQKTLLKDYGSSSPLGEALAGILRRYIAAWQEFDHLDHILRCIGALSCYLEQEDVGRTLSQEEADRIRYFREALCQYSPELEGWELVEIDKRYWNPCGYYFSLAYEYPEDVPDPGSRDVAPGALRSQIFLSERNYSPEALRELAAKSPSSDLRALLEKYVCEEQLISAMREINIAVTDLFALFVEPYLQIGVYCYEKYWGCREMDKTTSLFKAW